MVRYHYKKNDLDEAKKHFFLEKGYQPNDAAVIVLMNCLCERGRVKKAIEVFEVMGTKGFKMFKYKNCLLKRLFYVGKVEEALEVFVRMKGEKKSNFEA
ncbi:putative pentatricopeptide [Lupinus albus]|uniref:Putative pentatricopeptide n=1 Tax=Lupinus albus TaxID=3870 RepID=A0A6A4PRX1_LUPAL|nr:putative pentatricopeptide [Lupinus albus]